MGVSLVFLAAILAVPSALAVDDVSAGVPEVRVHVDGTTFVLPTVEDVPVQVVGSVEVRDVDISVTETRCAASTKMTKLRLENAGQRAPECTAGRVATNDDPQGLIDADVALVLPSSSTAPSGDDSAPLATEAAIIHGVPVNDATVIAAAAAGASMLSLYAVWRLLKWTGFAAFLPLYSHITDDEILEDPNRGNIYRLIQTEPGISTKDIADRLDLAWGTVTHHLGKLEKRRFVVSKKYGKYRRYFANGAGGSQDKDALAVLRLDRTGDVAELIIRQPGVTQKAVSQALGVSSSTILWHVKRLEEVNLVRKVREGKLVRYYPGDGMPGVTLIPAAHPVTAA